MLARLDFCWSVVELLIWIRVKSFVSVPNWKFITGYYLELLVLFLIEISMDDRTNF